MPMWDFNIGKSTCVVAFPLNEESAAWSIHKNMMSGNHEHMISGFKLVLVQIMYLTARISRIKSKQVMYSVS